jgi:glycosyltransferase involved in cell wall biosynthesis
MRILYLSQYFPPEVGATQTRSFEMARFLTRQGHRVTVIAGIPNHPAGVIHPLFRGTFFRRRRLAGIDVAYVPCLVFRTKNFLTRLLFYFSYSLSATVAGFLACRTSYDIVYATSPPLPVGVAALMLHWGKQAPLLFEVRDLWPASAIALSELKGHRLIRIAAVLEKTCYAAASKIIVVTEGISAALRRQGVPSSNIEFIPTGATVEAFFRSEDEGKALRAELGLEGAFVVLYAGILGIAQGLGSLLAAFVMLPPEMQCRLILVGDGPKAVSLKRQVKVLGLEGMVRFLGLKAREQMPGFYAAADAALVPLRRLDIFRGARPLKMFDAWACETPVLLGIEGEAADILNECGGGVSYRPEDPLDLARAIVALYRAGEGTRRRMGRTAREFVIRNHSIQENARHLERLIKSCYKEAS